MIRKFKYRHHIYTPDGYVCMHVVEIKDGFIAEFVEIPTEFWRGRRNT